MSRRTSKELADSIIENGQVLHYKAGRMVVSAFGQTYQILYPFGVNPKITQLKGDRNVNHTEKNF